MPRSLPLSLMHEVIGNPGGNLESASRAGGSGVWDFDLGTGHAGLRNSMEENTIENGGDDIEEGCQKEGLRVAVPLDQGPSDVGADAPGHEPGEREEAVCD